MSTSRPCKAPALRSSKQSTSKRSTVILQRPGTWPFRGEKSLSSLARIPAGRALTAGVTGVLERLRMAPAGTSEAARFLNVAADALVEAGELGIFTPSFLVHARKPA